MSDMQAMQEVVEDPGTGYSYLRTPATASLIVSSGANTGSVAAFSYDGSSVQHGPVTANQTRTLSQNLTVNGNILKTEFQAALAQASAAQPGFTTVSPLSATLDISSSEFRLEADLSAPQDLLSAGSEIMVDVGKGGRDAREQLERQRGWESGHLAHVGYSYQREYLCGEIFGTGSPSLDWTRDHQRW